MGCCSAKAGDGGPPIDPNRRRLSIGGNVDKVDDGNMAELSEEDRGMITGLNQHTVFELLKEDTTTNGRKFSICSDTDTGKTSFANKQFSCIGDEVDPASHGLGFTCRKGLKPEAPNQDSWMILKVDGNFSIYGVFDGHGQKGHDVSNFVKENLPKLIIRDQRFQTTDSDMGAVCKDAFKRMQSLIANHNRSGKLNATLSGTTCTIAIHNHVSNKVTVAHVADSSCVLGKSQPGDDKAPAQATQITRDHKPDLKDEKARIEKAGGKVVFDGYANHRIYAKNHRYPGLNMSRCLGDLMGHWECGLSCEPEIYEFAVTPEDKLLLLCSDGVWEFITAQEAVKIVEEFHPSKAMRAADVLAKEAWDRWIKEEGGAVVDDITVVLVCLQQAQKSAVGGERN